MELKGYQIAALEAFVHWRDALAEEKVRSETAIAALKRDHMGDFNAICLKGEVIFDRKMGELLKRTVETFGHDDFAMARVGHEAMTEWMRAG